MQNQLSGGLSLRFGAGRIPGFGALLRRWVHRADLARQRRALGRLDSHLLKDIGLDPEQARREAHRPVWDAPSHWRG
jgi:uncharacterized protein YjiS (DUF1127 family)